MRVHTRHLQEYRLLRPWALFPQQCFHWQTSLSPLLKPIGSVEQRQRCSRYALLCLASCRHTNVSGSLPPAHKKSWYVVRSEIEGATPESVHAALIEPPPVKVAPPAGLVNLMSACTEGTMAVRRTERVTRRIVGLIPCTGLERATGIQVHVLISGYELLRWSCFDRTPYLN